MQNHENKNHWKTSSKISFCFAFVTAKSSMNGLASFRISSQLCNTLKTSKLDHFWQINNRLHLENSSPHQKRPGCGKVITLNVEENKKPNQWKKDTLTNPFSMASRGGENNLAQVNIIITICIMRQSGT